MAHRDGASSVQGNAIRITRLNIDGSIDPDFPVLTTRGFISATFSPEFEEGDEIAEKRADGGVCISWKADDTLKRLNFSLALCAPDPEAAALLAGGKIILDVNGEVIGYTSPIAGSVVGNPVAIEIWSTANVGGKPAAGTPYWHWVFPYVKVRYEGDREFGNSALTNEFTGQALGNAALVPTGLNPNNSGDSWVTYKEALENPFSYVRAAQLPPFGWAEGTPGSGNDWPADEENTMNPEQGGGGAATAGVGTAPTAGPVTGGEADGTLRVVTGTGAVWIVRTGEWEDSTEVITPAPAAVAIVTVLPSGALPANPPSDGDAVFYDDGGIEYDIWQKTAGTWGDTGNTVTK
jgi:hypothetical protein